MTHRQSDPLKLARSTLHRFRDEDAAEEEEYEKEEHEKGKETKNRTKTSGLAVAATVPVMHSFTAAPHLQFVSSVAPPDHCRLPPQPCSPPPLSLYDAEVQAQGPGHGYRGRAPSSWFYNRQAGQEATGAGKAGGGGRRRTENGSANKRQG